MTVVTPYVTTFGASRVINRLIRARDPKTIAL
jgi:hypothetical protein